MTGAPPRWARVSSSRSELGLPLLALLALGLGLVSLGLGPVAMAPWDVAGGLIGWGDPLIQVIIWEIRLPRAILAAAIGFSLGVAGAALQGLLRNPLADSALFGAPQAASCAAATAISTGISGTLAWSLPVLAIGGTLVSVALLLGIAGRNASLLLLILTGMALSALAGAGTALALNLAPNPFAVLEIAFWLLGSLEDRSFRHVALALPFIIVGCALLLWTAPSLRVLTLGEDAAASLGVHVARLRLVVIIGVGLAVGAGVAVAGSIGFIGLVAPHVMRALIGPDPARLLVPAGLAGAVLLLAADAAVRLIPAGVEIKVGVLTALLGVPVFLYLIRRARFGAFPGPEAGG